MKKTLVHLALASALATSLSFAQGFGHGRGMGQGSGNNSGNPPSIADMVAHRVSRLTTLLSLTTDQQAKATTLFTDAATANQAIHTSLQTAHTTLADAVKKNDAGAIESAATTIGQLTGQSIANESKADAAFYAILTPDQQTKLGTLHGMGGGMMGPGPMGFRGHRQ